MSRHPHAKQYHWFRNLNLYAAMSVALFCGFGSFYFAIRLIPIFINVADIIESGEHIGATGAAVIFMLLILGLCCYFFNLCFMLAQKRVIEIFYGGDK